MGVCWWLDGVGGLLGVGGTGVSSLWGEEMLAESLLQVWVWPAWAGSWGWTRLQMLVS